MSTRSEPRYVSVLAELIRRFGDEIKPGRVYRVETAHDDRCAHWEGKPCDCDVVCTLIEVNPPERN
jgi:hypothetical protein